MSCGCNTSKKVPLSIGWLSEHDLLDSALKLKGITVDLSKATEDGIPEFANWDDSIEFSTCELQQLGFE